MRKEYVKTTCTANVYVSEDGSRWSNFYTAAQRDAIWMETNHPRIIESNYIDTPEDNGIHLYKITCKEDWDYLYYTNWLQNIEGDQYHSPGWYGAIYHDGGDSMDWYEIINIKHYIENQEEFLTKLKDLTKS